MASSTYAAEFAALLQDKFKDSGEFTSNQFSVMPGRKFDRIVADTKSGGNRHVHAFVERETGHVYKSAGWQAPAKGVRFYSIEEAAYAADLHGGYLYAR